MKKFHRQKRKAEAGKYWVLVLALFMLVRWNSITAPFERDEGEYAYSAWLLRNGARPYVDSFLQKPPMIVYTYALAQAIDENSVWPPRMLASLFSLATIVLVSLITRRDFGEKAGVAAAIILVPMLMIPPLSPFAANTEHFMLLPLMGTIAIAVIHRRDKHLWPWFLAGSLGMFSVLYKPIALPPLLFMFIVWAIENYILSRSIINTLHQLMVAILGAEAVAAITLGYFFLTNSIGELWKTVVVFNRYYVESYGFTFFALLRLFRLFLAQWWMLFFLTFCFFCFLPRRWWYYAGLFFTSLLSVAPAPFEHYFLLLMPFWAILAAVSIARLAKLSNELFDPHPSNSVQTVSLYLLTFLTVGLILWPSRGFFLLSPSQLTSTFYWGPEHPFVESQIVGEHLKAATKSTDKVFVAGSEAQILFYAQRRSASRFVITFPLNIDTPLREEYQRQAIDELTTFPPAAIVLSRRATSNLWNSGSPRIFVDYLNKVLQDEYTLVGGTVWEGLSWHWQELTDTEIPRSSSLLLFVRNKFHREGNV
ncbi:glycosyltransferase family 39 protein [Candidatus Collierbacteria bacterium]|nr:glycosyltransferase family 39 protein [Candidatus Collierbacteria bacterium]